MQHVSRGWGTLGEKCVAANEKQLKQVGKRSRGTKNKNPLPLGRGVCQTLRFKSLCGKVHIHIGGIELGTVGRLFRFIRAWFKPKHAPQFWFSRQSIQAVKDDNGLITLLWQQGFILTPLMALHLLELLEQGGEVGEILRRVQDQCPPLYVSSQQLRIELRKLLRG